MSINASESAREYVARTNGLANAVRYHEIEVEDEEICHRILTSLPPDYDFVRNGFAIQNKFSLESLEHGLVNAEEPNKPSDGAEDRPTLAADFKSRYGGQGGGAEYGEI